MIRFLNVSLMRGTKPLLEGVDLTLNPGDKIGLIGANGAGKTSLFAMLRNELHPDQGEIDFPAKWRMRLNLAQALQVLAYECRVADGVAAPASAVGFHGDAASLEQIDGMFAHLEQALVAIDFLDADHPKKLMPRLKRLFARTQLETEEVNILRGIARQILKTRR